MNSDRPETRRDADSAAVSTEAAFVLEADDAHLLTEVGFLAAAAGDVARADIIFGALKRLRPGKGFPLIGLAVVRMNAGRAGEAALLLEQARCDNAEDQGLLRAWQGLALQLDGRAGQSRSVLNAAAHGEGAGARLARGLLGQDAPAHPAAGGAGNESERSY
ncbi:hypothetical protein ACFWP0_22270 [Achromobacter sp. NPDC058515]|uniref:hypothetical protein n=1 Tax=Achromobacter sp. NPDC058515 TaxID=3346533 RepID=UPI0036503EFD